jgi:hypothetical protein
MSPINRTDADFTFTPKPAIAVDGQYPPAPAPTPSPTPDPLADLGPLEALVGEWEGPGFNTIWRPHFPSSESDRFLELNLTTDKITFSPIGGEIPNRGLLQPNIVMFGITYLQQIAERGEPTKGLHIEPGIWAVVPQTTDPAEQPSVVRMASIPHGTTILAQGTAAVSSGPLAIPDNNIIPFGIGGTQPPNSGFGAAEAEFTQLNLATASAFREASTGVTQAMVEIPTRFSRKRLLASVSRRRQPLSSPPTTRQFLVVAPPTRRSCRRETLTPPSFRQRSGSRRSRAKLARPTACSSSTPRL